MVCSRSPRLELCSKGCGIDCDYLVILVRFSQYRPTHESWRNVAQPEPTRAALLNAGRSLFAHRDVDGVSVDEIVEAAAVAKGSFYNHFADKDVFAREIAASARREAEALVNEVNCGISDPAVAVARAL